MGSCLQSAYTIPHNVADSYTPKEGFHVYPYIEGNTVASLLRQQSCLPERVPPLTDTDVHKLQRITTADVTQMEQLPSEAEAYFSKLPDASLHSQTSHTCSRKNAAVGQTRVGRTLPTSYC